MPGKPKIIFVGDYSREDYVSLLKDARDYCDFFFLFYTSPNQEKSSFYKSYGKAIYWKDFTSAQQLLESISPDKVVFLYVESYNHVALNLACKQAATPTYLLEHGLRADYVLGFDPDISPGKNRTLGDKLNNFLGFTRNARARYNSRKFLTNSITLLPPEDQDFIKEFIHIRSRHNYLETFRQVKSSKRLADHYIGFSPKIYELFQEHEAPYFGGKPQYIGIPYFDSLAGITPQTLTRSILLIDQPLAEQGLLQWDSTHKQEFATQLVQICQSYNYQLYIKPHPSQDNRVWKQFEKEQKCRLLDNAQVKQLAGSIPVILGFYSTYLMPFATFPHTTVVTYEKHPAGDYLVSKPLVDAGVAEPIYTLYALSEILQNPEPLHQKQLPNKAQFTEDWMYKFDGKSGERLRAILLGEHL